MNYQNIKAVFFDLDGTLFDTALEINESANRMLSDLSMAPLPDSVTRAIIGKGAHNFVERALLATAKAQSLTSEASQTFQLQHQDRALERFLFHYEIVTATLAQPFPGVLDGLAQLAEKNLPMAVITNKQQSLAEKILREFSLMPLFKVVMGGDQMLHKKPHAWSLLEVSRLCDVSPKEAIYVGDSDNDVDAARAAGMRCVVLPYGYSGGRAFDDLGADGVISSLTQLSDHI